MLSTRHCGTFSCCMSAASNLGIIVLHAQASHALSPHAAWTESAAISMLGGAETACRGMLLQRMRDQSMQHAWA